MEHPTHHEPRETKYDRARQASRELFGDRRHRLEIGHASFVVVPGYDPRYFEEGTTIATIDPYRHETGGEMGNLTPLDDTDVRSGYSREAMERRYALMIQEYPELRVLPEYTHAPMRGDGRALPFADDSFDEVLLNNVVSDPGIPEKNVSKILSEALRVSRRVITSQDNTPDMAEERFDATDLAAQGVDVVSVRTREPHPQWLRALGLMDYACVYILTKNDNYDPEKGITLASIAEQREWILQQMAAERQKEFEAKREKEAAERRARRAQRLARFGLRRRGRATKHYLNFVI